MVKEIRTSDGIKLVDDNNRFAGSRGKGITPPNSSVITLDRVAPKTQKVDMKQFYESIFDKYTSKKEMGENTWSDATYDSASDKADAYSNPNRTWMAHPAHQDAYQVSAWGGLKLVAPASKGESCFIHLGVYDRATPATDPKTGEKGVVLSSGSSRVFYRDSEITSLDYSEREDADDTSTRIDNWRAKQGHSKASKVK